MIYRDLRVKRFSSNVECAVLEKYKLAMQKYYMVSGQNIFKNKVAVWLVSESFRVQCNLSRSLAYYTNDERRPDYLMSETRCECNAKSVQNRRDRIKEGERCYPRKRTLGETCVATLPRGGRGDIPPMVFPADVHIQERTRHVDHKFPANAPRVSCIPRNTEGCAARARFPGCNVGARLCARDPRKIARDVGR